MRQGNARIEEEEKVKIEPLFAVKKRNNDTVELIKPAEPEENKGLIEVEVK